MTPTPPPRRRTRPTAPAVVVDNVTKTFRLYHERNQHLKAALLRRRRAEYEEFWALRDVALTVPEGTTFGLIGENGSGKSTLLKCMARILRPDEGRHRGQGQGVGPARARRRLPPRAVGTGERLPQRLDPRAGQEAARRPSSTRSSSSPASSGSSTPR